MRKSFYYMTLWMLWQGRGHVGCGPEPEISAGRGPSTPEIEALGKISRPRALGRFVRPPFPQASCNRTMAAVSAEHGQQDCRQFGGFLPGF